MTRSLPLQWIALVLFCALCPTRSLIGEASKDADATVATSLFQNSAVLAKWLEERKKGSYFHFHPISSRVLQLSTNADSSDEDYLVFLGFSDGLDWGQYSGSVVGLVEKHSGEWNVLGADPALGGVLHKLLGKDAEPGPTWRDGVAKAREVKVPEHCAVTDKINFAFLSSPVAETLSTSVNGTPSPDEIFVLSNGGGSWDYLVVRKFWTNDGARSVVGLVSYGQFGGPGMVSGSHFGPYRTVVWGVLDDRDLRARMAN